MPSPAAPRRVAAGTRRGAVAVLLALAALVVAVLVLRSGGGEPTPGPLRGVEPNSFSFRTEAAHPFVYGVPVVVNHGATAARLRAVTPLRATPGLRILRTLVAGPRRNYDFVPGETYRLSFPDLSDLHPLAGYEVAPRRGPRGRRGIELVLILRAPVPGRYTFRGLRLDYESDGTEHRVRLPNAFAVCTARGWARGHCGLPPAA